MEEEKNMFAQNSKISARQVKYLLALEWIAVLSVLLPVCLEEKTMGSLIFCVALGAVLWSVVVRMILTFVQPGRDFFDAVSDAAGKSLAVICYAAGLLFFAAQAAVFLNLSAEMTRLYLLPEVPVPVLCLLPLAAGMYLSRGSVEVRGRFCEAFGPAVLGLLVLLLFLSAFGMQAYLYEETAVRLSDHLLSGGLEVLACLGGAFLPILGTHFACGKGEDDRRRENSEGAGGGKSREKKGYIRGGAADPAHARNKPAEEFRRAVFRAFLIAVTFGGCLCAVTAGSYGKSGMKAIAFPSVRVMSNVKVPGSFLQRWDIFFFALLLVCMVVTLADALWYMQEILTRLWTEGTAVYEEKTQKAREAAARTAKINGTESAGYAAEKNTEQSRYVYRSGTSGSGNTGEKDIRQKNPGCSAKKERDSRLKNRVLCSWGAGVILVYAAAAGFLSSFTAICYYRALNLQLLVPLLLFFYIIICFQRMRNGQKVLDMEGADRSRSRRAVILSRAAVLVLLLAASAVFLGGCTAREPEERLFPMALEIGAEDGTLVLTCAWNEGAGPGGGGETGDSQEAESEKTDIGTLTVFRGDSLEKIQKQVTAFTEKYVDYSHVKAIIIDETLKSLPEQEAEVMEWFASEPAFASGLIVYPAQKSGLTLERAARNSSGKIGSYLEGLYKNNEQYRQASTTLGMVIAEYHRNT